MNPSPFSLKGKVALITGGSRGIGESTAISFAKAGADVALTSRKQEELDRVAARVEEHGGKAFALAAHIGRIEQIQELVDAVAEKLGKIDILVNNAGTNFNSPAIEMTEKAWDSVMNLNLKGVFFLSQAVARVMKENDGGMIVNISSTSGFKVQVPAGHYSIAKSALIMATKVMALEWAPYKIRANCIAPGPVKTALYDAIFDIYPEDEAEKMRKGFESSIPLQRAGDPDEIANCITFLASDASSYVTGQTFAADGGMLLT